MPTGNAAAFQQLHRNQTEEWPSQTAQGKQTGNDALINQLTEKRGLKAEE